MKDLFSSQSGYYARYRPLYPQELYNYLFHLAKNKELAWDAGTGNGQVARVLAETFTQVVASDISETQLSMAPQKENIRYLKGGETIPAIGTGTVDLITVATAIHWFDFETFYTEVKRVAAPGCIIAVWCYSLLRVDHTIDRMIDEFSLGLLGPYWDKERRYVDEAYRTIPFPFGELPAPELSIKASWTPEQLEGYINSWSSIQHYIKANGENPAAALMEKLRPLWTHARPVEIPLNIRVGLVNGQ